MPVLSILIVNWNSSDFLRKCLSSIYANALNEDFEVIVVDNASFDGSEAMVAQYFPTVRFIQSPSNMGFAGANNLAFQNSTADNVLLLNPDTEVLGTALQDMLAALRRLPDAGIVGCKLLNTDLSTQTTCIKRFPTILGELLSIEWLRKRWPRCSLWSIDPLFSDSVEPVRVDAICGACQLIRRDAYQAVGGLNTKYFMYGEDIEICDAVGRTGLKTYYLGQSQIIHHGGQSSGGKDRGGHWISIMQKEAMWRLFRDSRGSRYAALYRLCIGFASSVWLLVTLISSPLIILLRGGNTIRRLINKWGGALQWSIGFQDLTSRRHVTR